MYLKAISRFLLLVLSISLFHDLVAWPPTLISPKTASYFQQPNSAKYVADIMPSVGFKRVSVGDYSFAAWLRKIKLKTDRTVYLFDGKRKANQSAQFAVLDIPVGKKDLQQCADAVMRLRAMYLFEQQRYTEIVFFDNQEKPYRFTAPYTAANLDVYLERVFVACGSASLSKQLKPVMFEKMQAGDVLIRGGFPGHAEIVIDMAINQDGKKEFMLAQSYMPAQDIHVLVNPSASGPWYPVNDNAEIVTPEYTFLTSALKRW